MNTYLWILTWLRKRDHVARAPWWKRKSKQYMSRVVSFSIFRDARALSICAWHRRPRVTLKLQGPSHSQITTPELFQSPGSNLRKTGHFEKQKNCNKGHDACLEYIEKILKCWSNSKKVKQHHTNSLGAQMFFPITTWSARHNTLYHWYKEYREF